MSWYFADTAFYAVFNVCVVVGLLEQTGDFSNIYRKKLIDVNSQDHICQFRMGDDTIREELVQDRQSYSSGMVDGTELLKLNDFKSNIFYLRLKDLSYYIMVMFAI